MINLLLSIKEKHLVSLIKTRLSNEEQSTIEDDTDQIPLPFEEPAPKKYRCSVTSSTGQQDDVHDVYYCMNVVIQSRAFQMNQEIVEGNNRMRRKFINKSIPVLKDSQITLLLLNIFINCRSSYYSSSK